ncbi:MAG: thymidine kinase [Kosmotogales bacterium]|nr:thymidine kinase [Kosmotogales bacterium]
MSGKLTMFIGPMYSGKTSSLLSMVEVYNLGKKNFKVYKPAADNRYSSDHIVSHTGQKYPAINVPDVKVLFDDFSKESKDLTAVFIDEIHFFDEGLVDVVQSIILSGVDVYCSGLDMSFKHRPFETTIKLMGIADEIVKNKAVCNICGEYKAVVTHKINNNDDELEVGGREKYIAVCRDCYVKLNPDFGKKYRKDR